MRKSKNEHQILIDAEARAYALWNEGKIDDSEFRAARKDLENSYRRMRKGLFPRRNPEYNCQ